MPQLSREDGDDLGASDELIAFKDEGEQEEKRNVSAERDLDDVKSSLVNESETNSSSDSEVSQSGATAGQPGPQRAIGAVFTRPVCSSVQADRRPEPRPGVASRGRQSQLSEEGKSHSAALWSLWARWEGDGLQQQNTWTRSSVYLRPGETSKRHTCNRVQVFLGTLLT